jgi:hemerythrin
MRTFLWDTRFRTGLRTVDEQHHRLVDLINELGESLVAGSDAGDSLQGVYEELADYAKYHFAEEERLMEEGRIDKRYLTVHRALHQGFIRQITSMWGARNTASAPVTVLHDFLTAWLTFHILDEDHRMARQLARIAGDVSPAEAFTGDAEPADSATHALLRAVSSLFEVLSQQNRELVRANQILEQRVAERTEELVRANVSLEQVARTDGLLGIGNRMWFDMSLDREWRRAIREQIPIALCMIDVDFFKPYNDRYGHQAGDECLRAAVRAGETALRRPADLLARYGGDELVALLPRTDLEGARFVARAVHDAVKRLGLPHAESPIADHVTVSIGVAATAPQRGSDRAALIVAADQALYQAKEGGRNRVAG